MQQLFYTFCIFDTNFKVERVSSARLNVNSLDYGTPTARCFGHSFETRTKRKSIECDLDASEDSGDVYCRTGNDVGVFPKIGSGQKKQFCKCRDHVLDIAKNIFLPNHPIWQIYCQ